ncbi:MAG: peptidylprolyl isomerase [Oscillospiraceae bacterium]
MSASREKKARQERNASGYVDPKQRRAEEERKAAKRSNLLYGTIAVLFVVVAVFVIVWNSGVIQRNATAVTIDGEKYSASEMSFFYHDSYNQWYQQMGAYASYFGLDTSAPLNSQVYSEETGETWADYFCDQGVENMKWTIATYNEALANGYEWSEEDEESWNSTKETMETYAESNNVDYKTFLQYYYGSLITPAVYEKYVRMQIVANNYASQIYDGFSYDLNDLSQHYEENKLDYDVADYELVTVDGSVATKDEDGNEVEVTDEMKAEAMDKAKADAESILAAYQEGGDLQTLAEDAESYTATYSDKTDATYSSGDILDWVFDDARESGDTTIIEGDDSVSVVVFHSRGRYDYNTVDVRHILVRVDTSSLDSESETYEEELEALKAEAKAEADSILQQWLDGEKTEESFAALADELSDDGAEGGLYTQVAKGDMVTEFNDWIFAEGRQSGDAEVIYAEQTGYHVMYFVGENVPYWQVQVEESLRSDAYSAWSAALVEDMTAETGSGMKYVKA